MGTSMPRKRFRMNFLAAVRAYFLLERSLPAMRALWTVPLLMLIYALPGHLFLTESANPPGLERACWLVSAAPTLRILAVMVVLSVVM